MRRLGLRKTFKEDLSAGVSHDAQLCVSIGNRSSVADDNKASSYLALYHVIARMSASTLRLIRSIRHLPSHRKLMVPSKAFLDRLAVSPDLRPDSWYLIAVSGRCLPMSTQFSGVILDSGLRRSRPWINLGPRSLCARRPATRPRAPRPDPTAPNRILRR
jgi:hypothetical protein